jgi:hypothetical protein
MATLSWAPLKNSGFRSVGMTSVALLVVFNLDSVEVSSFAFSGIHRRP